MADSTSGTSSTSSAGSTGSGALLQFSGVSSGLDTKALIDALLQADTARVTSYATQITNLQSTRTAYGTLQTSMLDLVGKLQNFTMLKFGSSRSTTSSDSTRLTALANPSASPAQYTIGIDHLASTTVATSTAAIGTQVADPSALLSSLPFAGSIKGGNLTLVVDGRIVTATVGDPTTTTLGSAMDSIAAAVQSTIGGDGTAAVSVAANHLQIAISGNASSHSILVGAGTDTSNLFSLAGLTGQSATIGAGGGSMTGSSALGVAQMSATLDSAGLTGLVSTTTGKMTINGIDIAYDTTKDSLTAVLSRINDSQAGVIASVDRTNDKIILTSKTAGAQPITLTDTGTLLSSLNLQPGTINAQAIGSNALLYVNGRPITSATNQVTNAIDNVTLTLVAPTTTDVTLTVGVDQSKIQGSLTDLVNSYNGLADQLDALTANGVNQAPGALAPDLSVRNLLKTVRQQLFTPLSSATGSVKSLADLGVTTGKVGSAVGTTNRLMLDTNALNQALANDPSGVAQLLGPSGALAPLVSQLKSWTDYGGTITSRQRGSDDEVRSLTHVSIDAQERLDTKRAALEAKYAKMEATLSTLQQQLSSLTSQAAQFNK